MNKKIIVTTQDLDRCLIIQTLSADKKTNYRLPLLQEISTQILKENSLSSNSDSFDVLTLNQ
mgnify:CR=1 FL=1